MDSVLVLMSTYNGEKYIEEQIESILKQNKISIRLLVRDDGSTDDTLLILRKYAADGKIDLIEGKNVGAVNSFFELIKISRDADYYSFADQDDVWDYDKIYVAVKSLKKVKASLALYSSNTRLIDENNKFIKNENDDPILTLESAFIKNYCTGCTAVFTHALMEQLKMYKPIHAVMHDWWISLLVLSLGGESIYDIVPHMGYRQHGNNVSGAESSFLKKTKNRFLKFINGRYHRELMASEIRENYLSSISPETDEILLRFINEDRSIVFDKKFRTKKIVDTFLFRLCVIFNKF